MQSNVIAQEDLSALVQFAVELSSHGYAVEGASILKQLLPGFEDNQSIKAALAFSYTVMGQLDTATDMLNALMQRDDVYDETLGIAALCAAMRSDKDMLSQIKDRISDQDSSAYTLASELLEHI